MSDDKSQQQEPTMEEILASIRRIISENDEGEGQAKDAKPAAAAKPAEKPVAPPEAEEAEILELTEVVAEDKPAAGDGKDDGNDLVMEDAAAPEPEPEPAPEPASEPAAAPEPPPPPEPLSAPRLDADSLVSPATAAASTAALSQLAHALDRDHGSLGNIALGPGNTLEDLVKDMIRPMLKEWLDQNLAALVERLVRREIERMVRRAEDD